MKFAGHRDSLIISRLADEESLVYYNARKVYQTDPRLSVFYSNIRGLCKEYRFREVEEHVSKYGTQGFIIIGTDDRALYDYLVLDDSRYETAGVFPGGTDFQAVDARSFSEEETVRLALEKNYAVVIGRNELEKYKRILSRLDESRVFAVEDHVVGRCGQQYFDYFSPGRNEVFLDGGSLDGRTTQQFIEWCQESYEAVYAVEPNPRMRGVCREHFRDNAKIQFYPCALWNRQERLRFENRGSKWDARVCSLGQVLVDADTIDHIIGAHRVSLIKLDVEGSEMEALEGARQCIQRDRPRLAVSIYHKPEDMDNICGYLLSIVPDYRFSIRHYHSDAIETILYGFTE